MPNILSWKLVSSNIVSSSPASSISAMLLTLTMVFIISVSGLTAAKTPSSCRGPSFAEMELNYSLPIHPPCGQVRLSNGSIITTIPKLIPVRIMNRCQRDGIPGGHRICRRPDCLSGPCQRGWCEETMEGYQCHCPEGLSGKDCSEADQITTGSPLHASNVTDDSGSNTTTPGSLSDMSDVTQQSLTMWSSLYSSFTSWMTTEVTTMPTEATTMSNEAATMSTDATICTSDQGEYDGSCYHFSQEELSFDSSKSSCKAMGMHLVYIGSQGEQTFLEKRILGNKKRWIGLSPLTWKDESSLTYNNFPEPDFCGANHKGLCFRMFPDQFKWSDSNCSSTYRYVCEKESSSGCNADQIEEDGSCYNFSSSQSDFPSSQSSCESLGMHLVYVESEDEQEFLDNNLPDRTNHYWIGLSSITWLDGSTLAYGNFAVDSKTFNQGAICFVIEPGKLYQWLDDEYKDDHKHHYICERERDM